MFRVVSPGELREYVRLLKPMSTGITELNEPVSTETDFVKVAAKVTPIGGAERYDHGAGQRYPEQLYRVTIRFRPDIRTTWRLRWLRGPLDARELDILALANMDEHKRYLELTCRAVDEAVAP